MKRLNLLVICIATLFACGSSCDNGGIIDPAKNPGKTEIPNEPGTPGDEPGTPGDEPGENPGDNPGENPGEDGKDVVTTPPADLTQWLNYKESPLDPFYQKYVNCDGLPVLSSKNVADEALLQACYIAREMTRKHPESRDEMIKCHFRIGVVGYKENITDLPECSVMPIWWPDTDWNARGRGYGATEAIPVMSIGEENLIKIPNFQERYYSESIMVHEFGHNVDFAMRRVDAKFKKDLLAAFKNAQEKGLWKGTYSMDNDAEYFAEGAQAWYNTCRMVVPNVKGSGSFKLKTREQLKDYDPMLYDLLAYTFPEEFLSGYHFDFE